MQISLRYDLRAPAFGASPTELHRAMIEQCEWADSVGFDVVKLTEHHASDDGYMPSPLVYAAAIATRTRRLRMLIAALLLPLHDPIRIAEDAAVVDLISEGRLSIIAGGGYVPAEYAMFGKELGQRRALLDRGIEIMKQAWKAEPFDLDGVEVLVTPKPFTPGGPPLLLGGSTPGVARRAAQNTSADGFGGQAWLQRIYVEECVRLGRAPGLTPERDAICWFLHVSKDPDADWERLAPYAMHENDSYVEWGRAGNVPLQFVPAADPDELRASGNYRVVTPAEMIELAEELGPDGDLRFNPLMGGMPPEMGWAGLQLFQEEVLPELRRRGLRSE